MGTLDNKIINQLVFNLRKPARYIGHELNVIKKDNTFIKMAICYPDLYEIGMSNNGIKIIYGIANSIEDVSCERVFAVPDDFEQKIRSMKIPLYTLETYTPLCELDIIGFNVAYELLYTNILQILDLGCIPVFSRHRKEEHPIVIGGGESVSNPLPISDFFDVFFIGDGEEGIVEILNTIKHAKIKSLKRHETIKLLGEIEGVYIPDNNSGIHKVITNGSINKKENAVKKRISKTVDFSNPTSPIMPNMGIVQERMVIEATRGCKNLCNYCHSGFYELPYRYVKPEILRDRVMELIKNAHYSELTLSSLSISDYNHLVRLLNYILPELIDRGISISLPSLKVNKRTLPVIQEISEIRKSSLTFAVESGCEEIRRRANKKLQTDDIINIAKYIFNNGWNTLKLYFMIGLPECEEYDEADAIIGLLRQIYIAGNKKKRLNVTISPFVPKPHTPFQWEKQMGNEYLTQTILKIKQNLPRNISIKAHNVNASILEGIMARGDARLSNVIYNSYMEGCRLDSWKENFNFEIWEKNLNTIHDWKSYLNKRDENLRLPWAFISTGFESLIIKQKNMVNPRPHDIEEKPYHDELDINAIKDAVNRFKRKYNTDRRIRIKFSKTENAKYISHLDFMAIIVRGLRLINMPVSFTQGYNKRERISMGFPSPVGIESICELCDVDLYEDVQIEDIAKKLTAKLPEGITALDAGLVKNKDSIMSITRASEFHIEINDPDLKKIFIRNLELKNDFIKDTKKGKKIIRFDSAISANEIIQNKKTGDPGRVVLRLLTGDEDSIRIDNIVLNLAETDYNEFYKFRIIKTCQYRMNNGTLEEIK